MKALSQIRARFFGISPREASFVVRGFCATDRVARRRLERIGRTFLRGYRAAITCGEPSALTAPLVRIDLELRGFAYEGAAMGLALLDYLLPRRTNRFRNFLEGAGRPHVYMVHVGMGWAIARIPWARRWIHRQLSHLDPLLRWLVVDGYGFHQGYFNPQRSFDAREVPATLSGYACHAFDQGLGRSLWFARGADAQRIRQTIAQFSPDRQADLWSGVGLACSYAGGVDNKIIEAIRNSAGQSAIHLAQGAAFAAKARQLAGNPAEATTRACEIFCGMSADRAAMVTDQCRNRLSGVDERSYEVWRTEIRHAMAATTPREVVA
jgi:hypothetical protein